MERKSLIVSNKFIPNRVTLKTIKYNIERSKKKGGSVEPPFFYRT